MEWRVALWGTVGVPYHSSHVSTLGLGLGLASPGLDLGLARLGIGLGLVL